MNKLIVALIASTVLAACQKKPEASFEVLEDARGTARENAIFNAQRYRQENILYKGFDIIARGDSTQSPSCPQGDGWATIDFVTPDKTKVFKVKCSTYSGNLGCMDQEDFKSKSYASEDGACQDVSKVPFPLPKIAK